MQAQLQAKPQQQEAQQSKYTGKTPAHSQGFSGKNKKNIVKQEKEFGTTASTGGSPAKSTRLTLADSMVVRPASSVVLLSTTQVKTEWDRLDSLFMLVAAVCLFCCPRRSRRAVSSTAGTTVCCHRCLLMWLTTAMEFKGQRGLI